MRFSREAFGLMLACDIAALIADRTARRIARLSTWKFGGFVIVRGPRRKRA